MSSTFANNFLNLTPKIHIGQNEEQVNQALHDEQASLKDEYTFVQSAAT